MAISYAKIMLDIVQGVKNVVKESASDLSSGNTSSRLTIENRWTADAKRRILSGCGAADASGVAS